VTSAGITVSCDRKHLVPLLSDLVRSCRIDVFITFYGYSTPSAHSV
jgi:hypothetical protein